MLNAADKSSVVNEVVKTVGQDKTIKNLLDAMAEHNRLGLLPGVIDKFEVLMGAHKGEMEVLITSSAVSCILD
jgi:F-type H+-transporting ATPase subunit O